MDDLFRFAIEAHGGLERWQQFNVVRTNVSITGALWNLMGSPDALKDVWVGDNVRAESLALKRKFSPRTHSTWPELLAVPPATT